MDKTFAEMIRSYRQRNGLTIAEMARQCGVSNQYLYSVEGGGDPSVTRADSMLRRLGLSLELGDGESIVVVNKKRRMRVS